MQIIAEPTPLRPDVRVALGANPTALEIITAVVGALDHAGVGHAADAFLYAARRCHTDADLLRLAHRTVDIL